MNLKAFIIRRSGKNLSNLIICVVTRYRVLSSSMFTIVTVVNHRDRYRTETRGNECWQPLIPKRHHFIDMTETILGESTARNAISEGPVCSHTRRGVLRHLYVKWQSSTTPTIVIRRSWCFAETNNLIHLSSHSIRSTMFLMERPIIKAEEDSCSLSFSDDNSTPSRSSSSVIATTHPRWILIIWNVTKKLVVY